MADKSKVDDFLKSRLQNRAKGSEDNKSKPMELRLLELVDNPYQPRLEYNPKELEELAQTIKENGLLQPISVTEINNQYTIIAGHRRKRAFELLGKEKIPIILSQNINDNDLRILATIENLIRVDLSLLEEAKAYSDIIASGMKLKDLAQKIGKSESDISRKRKLLKLSEEILKDIRDKASTNDVVALTLLRKIEDEKKQTKTYYGFLQNDRAWLKEEIDKLEKSITPINNPTPKCLLIDKNSIMIDSSNLDKKTLDKILKFLNKELLAF